MKYNNLLNRQIEKHSIDELSLQFPILKDFLHVISKTYDQLEREKLFAERSFEISESEYQEVNQKLTTELKKNKDTFAKLTEAVGIISNEKINIESEDIVGLANIINNEIISRKHAENLFNSLTSSLKNAILLENKERIIQYANSNLYEIFGLNESESLLKGTDCKKAAQKIKNQFVDPEKFINSIEKCVENIKPILGEEFELVNGRTFIRDYIPLYTEGKINGHLWSYTEITDLKIKDKKLAESEKWNLKIMNSALDAIITIDIHSKVTFWNPQAERIFGFSNEEALGKKLSDLIIPPVHRKSHHKGMENYMAHGHAPVLNKQIELPALNKWGQEIIIELYIIPISDGNQKYFCSFIRDITDKKQIQQEKERLGLVASTNVNGILFLNKNNEIFWSNNGFHKMTGFSHEEILGRNSLSLFKNPNSDNTLLQNNQYIFNYDENIDQELLVLKKDNKWFWAKIKGQPLEQNGESGNYFLMIEDITQERETRQLLKDYEEKLKVALNSVGDNYWEHDFDLDETTFLNPSNTFLGYNIDEVDSNKAKFWWDRIHPDDRPILIELDKEYLEGKRKDHNKQYRVIKKDGSILWVIDRGTVTEFRSNGTPKKIIGTHIDITNQKNLEEQLILAKEAAESSTRSKEHFLANMSHEIRTPMNAIVGMANQLNKTPLNDKQKFYLNTLQTSSENLLVIINDILDLSKIEAGELSIEKIGFEPKKVMANIMQVMSLKAEEKGLSFSNSICDPKLSPILIGDPYRLNQVFLNLVSNAIKFTPKGSVDIQCKVIEDFEEKQILEGRVIDTGIGIDKHFLKNIFQKFKQEDDSVTRKFGGTGLGMSICKNLIDLMGGQIFVESIKGKGTTVYFRVPLIKGTEFDLPKKLNSNHDVSKLKNKTILIADDNEMNRLVAATILENLGILVIEADNGMEAINLIYEKKPDLVLMDVQMPIMDGLEATKIIRKNYDNQLPIIALTALAIKGEEVKFKEAGMNNFLLKPFNEDQLIDLILTHIDHKNTDYEKVILESHPVPTEKLYNLERLEKMSDGNQVFINKMVHLFIDLSTLSMQQIHEAYKLDDFKSISKIAHKLKPSLENMGIDSLKDVIRNLESNAETLKKSPELKNLIDKVDDIISKVNLQLLKNL